MSEPLIQILLSTYNGGSFLQEQLNSIYSQTHKNWQIVVRDDNSTDDTVEILKRNIQLYPSKFIYVQQETGGNSTKSFMSLLKHANAKYIAFCDQDDFWKEEKLALSLENLQQLEKVNAKALVFTDMVVVDEKLNTITASFMNAQKFNEDWLKRESNVYAQSMAAGCTMLFTNELAENLKSIEPNLFQHDHWLMINAKNMGELRFIAETTVLYRQHNQNVVGSHKIGPQYFLNKLSELQRIWQRWKFIQQSFEHVSLPQLFYSKLKLNLTRLFKT